MIMKFHTAAICAAAAITLVGCDQQRQRADAQGGPSVKSERQQIDKSANEAKNQIDAQAKVQKEQIDAEQTAAQAQIRAEQARARAATNNTQARIDAATQQIRDAAGSASARVQNQIGGVSSSPASAANATGAPATADQNLKEQVCKALGITDPAAAIGDTGTQVTVNSGTVTLAGTVASEDEKTRMETAAKAVAGVTEVKNELQVKAP